MIHFASLCSRVPYLFSLAFPIAFSLARLFSSALRDASQGCFFANLSIFGFVAPFLGPPLSSVLFSAMENYTRQ